MSSISAIDDVSAVLSPARGPLPSLLRRHLERSVWSDEPMPARVRIDQIGDMWRAPGGRPMHFTAVEEFAVSEIAFSWQASFPLAAGLTLRIQDGYADDEGWMRGRVCGVPFMHQAGPEIAVGAAMRYLAELPWVPFALAANDHIQWREVDARTVEAACQTDGGRATVMIEFDAHGDIVHVYSPSRPRHGDVPRPWRGFFGDYGELGGIRVPRLAEVRWELPDGPFTYWRAIVTGLTRSA